MAWNDDNYIRTLLDAREKWVTALSITAVAGIFVFLADHPHHSWLNLAPFAIGVFGFFYILVVNSYNEQAQAIAETIEKSTEAAEIEKIKDDSWIKYIPKIGCLGWINIVAPLISGAFATIALYYGLLPQLPK